MQQMQHFLGGVKVMAVVELHPAVRRKLLTMCLLKLWGDGLTKNRGIGPQFYTIS